MTHWFTLILVDSDGVYEDETDELFGEMADKLFEAGCVQRVEQEVDPVLDEINAQLASGSLVTA